MSRSLPSGLSRRWPWNQTGYPRPEPNYPIEQPKPVVTKNFFSTLSWHFWTLVPCFVTAVPLYLNLSGYVVGTEVGKNSARTQDILGALQVASKVLEIIILIGLANIVQQAIQRSLIDDGMILGFVGAELSIGNFLFLISQDFLSALRFGFSGEQRSRGILFFVALIFTICCLSTVVGPASALLMAPHQDWYFESTRDWIPSMNTTHTSLCYPYILIDPQLGGAEYTHFGYSDLPIPSYWQYTMYIKNHYDIGTYAKENTDLTHQFFDIGLQVTVNSTTTWDRPLRVGQSWAGGTTFRTVARMDPLLASIDLVAYQPLSKNIDSNAQFFADMTGIESRTVCRMREKLSCSTSNETRNTTDWCFKYVTEDNDQGTLLRSRDLLLIAESGAAEDSPTTQLPAFWMTEGPRSNKNHRFTESIVFVFEDTQGLEQLLTVCSTTATLQSVTAISSKKAYNAEQVEFYDRLDYFSSNTTTYIPPQTILYHENWLDMIHESKPNSTLEMPTSNKTYTARSERKPTNNTLLKPWAVGILNSVGYGGGYIWDSRGDSVDKEATAFEIITGGPYISMLSRMTPSDTQYSIPDPDSIVNKSIAINYPQILTPETIIDCAYRPKPLTINRQVYGYKKTIPRILSMIALLVHCVIAIVGSCLQLYRGSIIQAWGSMAEYATLFIGTDPEGATIDNTCAGIQSTETLEKFVRIRRSERPGVPSRHLEVALAPQQLPQPLPSDADILSPNTRYG